MLVSCSHAGCLRKPQSRERYEHYHDTEQVAVPRPGLALALRLAAGDQHMILGHRETPARRHDLQVTIVLIDGSNAAVNMAFAFVLLPRQMWAVTHLRGFASDLVLRSSPCF
jgi:hypothetical protein